MKNKKIMFLLMLFSVTFSLAACTAEGDNQSTKRTARVGQNRDAEDEDDAEDNEDDEDEDSKKAIDPERNKDNSTDIDGITSNYIMSYSGITGEYSSGEYFTSATTEEYQLDLIDSYNCVFTKFVKYNDNVNSYKYVASYSEDNGNIIVNVFDGFDYIDYYVSIEDDQITNVMELSSDTDYSPIIGSVSFKSELGLIEFEVDRSGIVDQCIYVGGDPIYGANLYLYDYDGDNYAYDPEWNLTFSYGDDYYDWYLYFNKRGITYKPYREAIYSEFAGTYEMDGELGVITVEVNSLGDAVCDVKINGEDYHLEGTIGYDSYEDRISFSLYSDDCSLYLDVDEFEDCMMYTGSYSITKEMAAG